VPSGSRIGLYIRTYARNRSFKIAHVPLDTSGRSGVLLRRIAGIQPNGARTTTGNKRPEA
jgi:hypothetical protein